MGQAHEEEEGWDRGLDCAAVADLVHGAVVDLGHWAEEGLEHGAVADLGRGSMVDLGCGAEGRGVTGRPRPWSSEKALKSPQ